MNKTQKTYDLLMKMGSELVNWPDELKRDFNEITSDLKNEIGRFNRPVSDEELAEGQRQADPETIKRLQMLRNNLM